jgi:hypothetical protein
MGIIPFAHSLPTNASRKPTEARANRQWTPLVGQVETKGETDYQSTFRIL